GDRAVVFGGDHQDGIGGGDLGGEAVDLGGTLPFEVLVVERQVVDADEAGTDPIAGETDQGLGQAAIDRVTAGGADDDGEIELVHGSPHEGKWKRSESGSVPGERSQRSSAGMRRRPASTQASVRR